MKRKAWKLVSVLAALVLAAGMILTGCRTVSPTTAPTTAPSITATPAPVTLKILAPLGFKAPNGIHDNPVINALRDATGVTIDWINLDTIADKVNYYGVMLASGDLPDMGHFNLSDDKTRGDILAANVAIPLDDLIARYGPNIQKNGGAMMSLMKGFKSKDGDGKDYFIGVNGGSKDEAFSFSDPIGSWCLRWDIYKSIGSPVIKTDADLLNVMKQMQDKYPATPDGKKTYGLSGFFAETGQYGCWYPSANLDSAEGWQWEGSGPAFFNNNKTNYFMTMYDDNSPWLRGLKLANKAYQMGLMDPESFTMKVAQYLDKVNAGRILVTPVGAGGNPFNMEMNKEGKNDIGYAPIPYPYVFGQSTPSAAYAFYPGGWVAFFITPKCKTPDRAIQLLNYTFSEEGMLLLYNGIEGQQWDVVNGVRTFKPDVIKSMQTDPDYGLKTGVGAYAWLAALTGDTQLSDGQTLSIGVGLDTVLKNMTPFTKMYCKDIGVTYPAEKWLKEIKPVDSTYYSYISIGDNADLLEIQTKITNYMDVQAPQIVACKTDAAFAAKWAEIKAGFDALGYQKLYAAAKAALDKARAVYTPEGGFVGN